MNSIIQAVNAGLAQSHDEGIMLVRLRDRLTGLGVNAELRDNNSVLLVHRPVEGLPVWVFVGYGGACYSWQNAEKRHPTSDPEGAANVLAEYVAR
ncbi:hypothetical protein ABT158_26215 [Nonomuraea sp. NPDC001636]|uniref:hypothetical protein n=1 Tax=Nonomuraea sp. NPDC001636 TaxID=3154391 RepID=UPI0033182B4C